MIVMELNFDKSDFLTVQELQDMLRISKNKSYELISRDDFPKIKIGKKYLIPKNEYQKFLKRSLYKEI